MTTARTLATRLALLTVVALPIGGCAITQTIHPADVSAGAEVCIIANPAVRDSFAGALRRALTNNGYHPRMLAASATPADCPVTMTYAANWRWDLAMYMAYARLQVFDDGKPAGDALYDSIRGSSNMGKFISADKKVHELVGQLFPKR